MRSIVLIYRRSVCRWSNPSWAPTPVTGHPGTYDLFSSPDPTLRTSSPRVPVPFPPFPPATSPCPDGRDGRGEPPETLGSDTLTTVVLNPGPTRCTSVVFRFEDRHLRPRSQGPKFGDSPEPLEDLRGGTKTSLFYSYRRGRSQPHVNPGLKD